MTAAYNTDLHVKALFNYLRFFTFLTNAQKYASRALSNFETTAVLHENKTLKLAHSI